MALHNQACSYVLSAIANRSVAFGYFVWLATLQVSSSGITSTLLNLFSPCGSDHVLLPFMILHSAFAVPPSGGHSQVDHFQPASVFILSKPKASPLNSVSNASTSGFFTSSAMCSAMVFDTISLRPLSCSGVVEKT